MNDKQKITKQYGTNNVRFETTQIGGTTHKPTWKCSLFLNDKFIISSESEGTKKMVQAQVLKLFYETPNIHPSANTTKGIVFKRIEELQRRIAELNVVLKLCVTDLEFLFEKVLED